MHNHNHPKAVGKTGRDIDVVLHVGLHKTATTFLQQEVFPKLDRCDSVNYVNLSGGNNYDDILAVPIQERKINIISREKLSGVPYIIEDKPYLSRVEARMLIARRLANVFLGARVLVGVRDKDDWLRSVFRQQSKMNPVYSSYRYFRDELFHDELLDFEGYIELLKELFSDVYVYRYEDLKEDYMSFVDGICRWIGVETPGGIENQVYNRGWSESQRQIVSAVTNMARKGYLVFRHIMEWSNRKRKG